jgi:hypothetical protein
VSNCCRDSIKGPLDPIHAKTVEPIDGYPHGLIDRLTDYLIVHIVIQDIVP